MKEGRGAHTHTDVREGARVHVCARTRMRCLLTSARVSKALIANITDSFPFSTSRQDEKGQA